MAQHKPSLIYSFARGLVCVLCHTYGSWDGGLLGIPDSHFSAITVRSYVLGSFLLRTSNLLR